MSTQRDFESGIIGRRGELLAELFLQELDPAFLAKSEGSSLPYDFFVGFTSSKGGMNTYAVEVKATDHPVTSHYVLKAPRHLFDYLSSANIPVMLLVADVKSNRLYYAWGDAIPKPTGNGIQRHVAVKVPVTALDGDAKESLRASLTA